MLIISIPKSASTSLLTTLARLHKTDGIQLFFKDYIIPVDYQQLGKYHSDLREYGSTDAAIFFDTIKIYKQHIPPTNNNLGLLKNKKKVILLREPEDIVMAYYRADKKLLHEKRKEFKNAHTPEEWMQRAKEIGLLQELKRFYENWIKIEDEKLIIQYEDLLNNPQKIINSIENYFGLKTTNHKVILAKERYSRGNWVYTMPRVIKKYILKKIHSNLTS